MNRQLVIRPTLGFRIGVLLVGATMATQTVIGIIVAARGPLPHPWAVWPLVIASLVVVLLWWYRGGRLSARTDGDVLIARNFSRTWRLRRADLSTIVSEPSRRGGATTRHRVVAVVLRSGRKVRIDALTSGVVGADRYEHLAIELSLWLHPLERDLAGVFSVQPTVRMRRLWVVLWGAVAVWISATAIGDVGILLQSMELIRVAGVSMASFAVFVPFGAVALAHARGETGPTPEEDEREAARYYAEKFAAEKDGQ